MNNKMSQNLPKLDWNRINKLIELAIDEDIKTGDVTSLSVVPENVKTEARFVTREDCICAGLPIAEAVFKKLDSKIVWVPHCNEGDVLKSRACMATVTGNARAILTGERTALNFLQRLCGIATITKKYVNAVNGTSTKILDTRKTTPAWRNLEKYAVTAGGGTNHRIGLYDRIMIKDNHRYLAGLRGSNGLIAAIRRARAMYPNLEIEVEVDNLDEFKIVLKESPEYILLDNMNNEQMKEAVKLNSGKVKLEASGGITLERIPYIAKLGVDFISVGALTHSVKAVDISLEM